MLSATYSNNVLRGIFGQIQSMSFGSSAYLALSKTALNDDGTGIQEPSTNAGYERVLIGKYNVTDVNIMEMNGDRKMWNKSIIFFPEATADWGVCTHYAVYTSKTGGTPVFWGQLNEPITVETGKVPIFRKHEFIVEMKDVLKEVATSEN